MNPKQILVLGVGNILLRDEGVGVRIVEKLQQDYEFSEYVRLLDGGTLGLMLLDPIAAADYLIVVDAVQNGNPAGTIQRHPLDDFRSRVLVKNSLHQLDLLETFAYAEFLGNLPETVTIIGIEPEDMSPYGLELTKTIESRTGHLVAMVLEEIELAGGQYRRAGKRRQTNEFIQPAA